jgi:hypothetical protein
MKWLACQAPLLSCRQAGGIDRCCVGESTHGLRAPAYRAVSIEYSRSLAHRLESIDGSQSI